MFVIAARNEGDKPYDPFDEDYEIGSAAQVRTKKKSFSLSSVSAQIAGTGVNRL